MKKRITGSVHGWRWAALALVVLSLTIVPEVPGIAQEPDPWNPIDGLVLRGTVVTQDEDRTVIENGAVCIMDQMIEAVLEPGEPLPENFEHAEVVETDGVILPGLLNAHSHMAYNMLPLWEPPRRYGNRYGWTSPRSYRTNVNYPKKILTAARYFDMRIEAAKYAEIRALVGGTTAIQGGPPWGTGFDELMIRNIDYGLDVDDIYQHSLAITDGRFMGEVEEGGGVLERMNQGRANAWLIHLGEGVDEQSREEFQVLKRLGLLREETVVIHGTAFGESEFRQMAEVGTDLIWSPLSNRLLYGETTDIPTARAAGVNISLAPDWAPSGSKNLLGELKVADEIDNDEWGDVLSYRDLVDMCTINPARALHWDEQVGRIAPGYFADILVVDDRGDPYGSVVHAADMNVRLVLVGGDPLYGDEEFMVRLKGEDCEEIFHEGGRRKLIDVTKPGDEKSEQSLDEILGRIDRALEFDPEHMRTSFRETGDMTPEEFDAWLEEEFRGLEPVERPPIFSRNDDDYFDAIRNNENADLAYDLRDYYENPDRPVPSAGGTTVSANPSGRIGGWLRDGWSARLYEEPRDGWTGESLGAGANVEILDHRSLSAWSGYYRIRGEVDGRSVEGWVYDRFVVPGSDADRGLIDELREVGQ